MYTFSWVWKYAFTFDTITTEKACEKLLNVTNYQRKAIQNHSEICIFKKGSWEVCSLSPLYLIKWLAGF